MIQCCTGTPQYRTSVALGVQLNPHHCFKEDFQSEDARNERGEHIGVKKRNFSKKTGSKKRFVNGDGIREGSEEDRAGSDVTSAENNLHPLNISNTQLIYFWELPGAESTLLVLQSVWTGAILHFHSVCKSGDTSVF